jgi:xanthine dehydrogenase D subunit
LQRRLGKGARFIAGGTGAQLEWEAGAPIPPHLIDLGCLARDAAFATISARPDGGLRIGAAVTLNEVRRAKEVKEGWPALSTALGWIAAEAVRNLATMGGNVAGGTGCSVPALLALDASVEAFDGEDYVTLKLWDFLAGGAAPGEGASMILTAILLPPTPAGAVTFFEKLGLRKNFTPSVINAAGSMSFDKEGRIAQIRLAVGGGATPPQRLLISEAPLLGQLPDDIDWLSLRNQVEAEIRAPGDAFRTRTYRRLAAANVIISALGGKDGLAAIAPELEGTKPLWSGGRLSNVNVSEVPVSREAMTDRWRVRPDMPDKVAGRFRYLTDHREEGMLVAGILRPTLPHARIRRIDTAAAEALSGVAAIVTHRDVPGENAFGIIIQDQPAFCENKVRYIGDSVAAVAAIDEKTLRRALELIEVEYEPLPVSGDMEVALTPEAPIVHDTPLMGEGNLLMDKFFSRGDVDEAFADCAHMVEATYVTPRQMHAFTETEGGYAFPTEDGLTICVAGQHGHRDRMQMARILAMPEERIRIVSSPSGGAFGGKDELTLQPALALLAMKAGRGVRAQLDRWDSVISGMKRHPMRITMRTGCDADGHLKAQQVLVIADTGAYASLGISVLETTLEDSCGPYKFDNVSVRGKLVYTNNGVAGAFRGFGANEIFFALEAQISRLAEKAGIDPVSFRDLNLRELGSPGFYGQKITPSERAREMLAAAAANPMWRKPRGEGSDPRKRYGVGLALVKQGIGLGSIIENDRGAGVLRLASDGKVEAVFGTEEIGQGVLASIVNIVSDMMGCAIEDVRPIIGDTAVTPDSGSTTASRATIVIWLSSKDLAPKLSAELRGRAAAHLKRDPAGLKIGPGGIYDKGRNRMDGPLLSFAKLADELGDELPSVDCDFRFPTSEGVPGYNARFIHCYAAVVTHVTVDKATGAVEVLALDQHTAAGPVVDPAGYLGQIEGGGIQALGFTLTEDTVIRNGSFITRNLDSYMVPSFADVPVEMKVFADTSLDEGDEWGPRGIGEVGICGITPAIVAAVADATGIWLEETPFQPETLLRAMGGYKSRDAGGTHKEIETA